jgi:hypothetical protein
VDGHSRGESSRLAFKAYEIEELVDVYFYRRLGWLFAVAARAVSLTPNAVSVLGGVAGVIGGVLLYDRGTALAGFGFLVLYGIVDSADGQLARMTGQTSDLGRVLDGVAGYATHVAIFLAILFAAIHRDGNWTMLTWVLLAGISATMQAQMYDYHRTLYGQVVVHATPPTVGAAPVLAGVFGVVVRAYMTMQRRLIGRHGEVEQALAVRSIGGRVRDDDRARYRQSFYRPVRGWNMLGDNGRRYAIGVLAVLQRVEWFCMFVIVPMNVALVLLSMWQWRADRRFLASLDDEPAHAVQNTAQAQP